MKFFRDNTIRNGVMAAIEEMVERKQVIFDKECEEADKKYEEDIVTAKTTRDNTKSPTGQKLIKELLVRLMV